MRTAITGIVMMMRMSVVMTGIGGRRVGGAKGARRGVIGFRVLTFRPASPRRHRKNDGYDQDDDKDFHRDALNRSSHDPGKIKGGIFLLENLSGVRKNVFFRAGKSRRTISSTISTPETAGELVLRLFPA